jgi:transcriptional regulator with XRE-family HTH domain
MCDAGAISGKSLTLAQCGLLIDMKKVGPGAVDRTIGRNIRFQRMRLGLSLEQLAQSLGVTYQQVQKYEAGVSRLSGTRLERIAAAFDVPIMALLEGIDAAPPGDSPTIASTLGNPDVVRLLEAYSKIADSEMKRRVLALVERIADPSAE